MKQALSLTRKELDSYFSSPMALLFVGVFLVVTLFAFFFLDSFFARGIADVRALFEWLPVLLIFLVAALTMRQWSEEEQVGTLQILLTMPIRIVQLVLGKFLSVLALVAVALLLTLFLPITVGSLGSLDVGPVIGGYVAALLLASTYIAIGLFVSSRTDNQIVALTLTAIIAGAFHLIGAALVTDLFNATTAEILRGLGTGSRFESIQRGVIDLRDIAYYLSLTVFFLALNVISLDSKRWSHGPRMAAYRRNAVLTVVLLGLNLTAFNLLLTPVNTLRLDLTQNGDYTLSPVTRDIISNLQEPMLIRGYFSEENHPLLTPLIPTVRDTLEEYRIAANGDITVEFVDPLTDPEIEREANQTYGINPAPLQISDRSGVSVINAYFDILIRYGDQNVVLNYGDLIEGEQTPTGVDVRLRDLEYDLTSSIQRVVEGFQNIETVLSTLDAPATLTLYITPDLLPEELAAVPNNIQNVVDDIQARAGAERFAFETVDMSDPAATGVDPVQLAEQYGIDGIPLSFFSSDTFYLHMIVRSGDVEQVIFPVGDMSAAEIRERVESAIKRGAGGFLRGVGVWVPPAQSTDQFGQPAPSLQSFNFVQEYIGQNYEVRQVALIGGEVPADIEVLLVLAPQVMTDRELYAIDQFLMRGGKLFVAASDYRLNVDETGSLTLTPVSGSIRDMLAHYGVQLGDALVFDTQNEPFPLPVQRQSGGFTVTEIQAVNYPPFVDVRADKMAEDPMLLNLPAVTVNWAMSLDASAAEAAERDVVTLLRASDNAWLSQGFNIQPNPELYGNIGFPVAEERSDYPLAVRVTGRFDSFFADQPSPFVPEEGESESTLDAPSIGLIESSPADAQIVVVGSAEFLNDTVFQISQNLSGDRFLNNLSFMQNVVDAFIEDDALASIRTGGSAARLLRPLTEGEQTQWELINYAVALAALVVLGVIWQLRRRAEQPMDLLPPVDASADTPAYEGGD